MRRGISLTLVLFFATAAAQAGTIRDDRADSLYLALGANYPSVGFFSGSTSSYSYSASGVLIAPNWVVTAAHVVDQARSLTFAINGTSYAAAQWTPYPNWTGNLGAGYDIGLVRLQSSVTGVTPAIRYTGSSELGAVGTSVGFGVTGTGLTGGVTFDGRKRGGQNVLDLYYSSANRILLSDFDNPHNPADNAYGSATPLDLEFLIDSGDSGGGLFIDLGQGPRLAGVHSFGASYDGNTNSDYGDVSGHTRLSIYNSWIDSIMANGIPAKKGGGKGRGSLLVATDATASFDALQEEAVPEPGTLALAVTALAAVSAVHLFRRRKGQWTR
jgi:hypothetical protein